MLVVGGCWTRVVEVVELGERRVESWIDDPDAELLDDEFATPEVRSSLWVWLETA